MLLLLLSFGAGNRQILEVISCCRPVSGPIRLRETARQQETRLQSRLEARNGSLEKNSETAKTIFQCRLRFSKRLASGSKTQDFSAGCRFRSGSLEKSSKTAKTRFQCRLRARSGSLDAEKTICQGRLTVSTRLETENSRFHSRLRV